MRSSAIAFILLTLSCAPFTLTRVKAIEETDELQFTDNEEFTDVPPAEFHNLDNTDNNLTDNSTTTEDSEESSTTSHSDSPTELTTEFSTEPTVPTSVITLITDKTSQQTEPQNNATDSSTTLSYTNFPSEPTTEYNNSTLGPGITVPEEHGRPTWAIVLITLLLTFAAIFTILYVFRKYIVRKRKSDRLKLLSASQEGFFEGNDSDVGNL